MSEPANCTWKGLPEQTRDNILIYQTNMTVTSAVFIVVFGVGLSLFRLWRGQFRNTAQINVFCSLITELIETIGKAIGNNGFNSSDLCRAQSALIIFGTISSVLLSMLCAMDLITVIAYHRSTEQELKPAEAPVEPENSLHEGIQNEIMYYFSVLFGQGQELDLDDLEVSVIWTLAGQGYAGPADFYCWVTGPSAALGFFYVPVWITFLL
ncbi:hypothetical protein BC936DRAFT_138463 [Jimgerdemannia flammicorona]|uniref:Uncharacterized protein n=1 Tax=Jimgerdemannia flammicorona TaxID=994334 RepID=A0A433CDE0_9FUNG|nr:hypothetical protein BC936DRAFT_138463 [Jimgerdemannia flammicorona]